MRSAPRSKLPLPGKKTLVTGEASAVQRGLRLPLPIRYQYDSWASSLVPFTVQLLMPAELLGASMTVEFWSPSVIVLPDAGKAMRHTNSPPARMDSRIEVEQQI